MSRPVYEFGRFRDRLTALLNLNGFAHVVTRLLTSAFDELRYNLATMPDKAQNKSTRKSERLEHELLVAYRTVDGFITDWAVNISRGGIFINTRCPLAAGSVVRLIVSLPDAAFPFDLTGRVIRSHPFDPGSNQVAGMGIEFIDVDGDKLSRLERFVDRLRKELPGDDAVAGFKK